MKKQEYIGNWLIHACLLLAFFCLHIFINIPVPDSKNLLGSATSIDSGIFSSDTAKESSDPYAEPEENTECESDTISESISETNQINYPLFSLLKKRTDQRFGLHFSDHSELLSPPPEFMG